MSSSNLQKVRDFEAQYGPHIPEEERPAFHATPTIGWMNDPNGFSLYKGECHLFYQYHPYSNEWGPMHWGHLKTKDFIRWERLPVAIAPDEEYDAFGCFSGSAVELPDGRQLLMYTGVRRHHSPEGYLQDRQVQCIAIGDGVDYEKFGGNPVLDEKDLPAGGSVIDFRDPKIWRGEDGFYYAVIGNRTADDSGAVLLYRSGDGVTGWELVRTIDSCRNQYGKMWECPDFFPLDGRQILLVSPQEMMPVGLEFHAGYGTVCLMGKDDGKEFIRKGVQAIDYGLDFYAPQTLLTPDGRRVMIAWMQNWSTVGAKPDHCRWFGQMTLPRELTVRDGRLIQNPVRELENYRGEPTRHAHVPVSREVILPGVRGRMVDLTVTVRPMGEMYRWFRIHLAKDGEYDTVLRYRPDQSTLKIDRCRSGHPYDIVHTRSFLVRPQNGELKLRVVLDRFSLEVFVNDGEQAASAVIYTRQSADVISFEADGTALMDAEMYPLVF